MSRPLRTASGCLSIEEESIRKARTKVAAFQLLRILHARELRLLIEMLIDASETFEEGVSNTHGD
jgi:hypothetical protein